MKQTGWIVRVRDERDGDPTTWFVGPWPFTRLGDAERYADHLTDSALPELERACYVEPLYEPAAGL